MTGPERPNDPRLGHADFAAHDFAPDDLSAAGAIATGPPADYVWPTDPRTLAALDHWQDLKVGVLIHWGIYTAIGQGGSWSLHRTRLGDFTEPPPGWRGTDAEYHDWYFAQARTFTGHDYDPSDWATACADAGMRYLIFTAKHHDGYAMYNTAYSNLKCTAEDSGLGRDVLAQTFEAFRAAGLETGVYFSKADWSHPGYWDRARPITDRFHNYDRFLQPAKWDTFARYTHDQITELLTHYGTISTLWLDAGWVCAPSEPIDIDQIGATARQLQPDILVVDREVPGPEMNYRTPEQQIPDQILTEPWESCITMTRSWCSLRPDDPAKPLADIIHTLIAIIARGGNYLIGIGPDATGRMSRHVRQRLAELGDWLRICAPAVYATRPVTGSVTATGPQPTFLTVNPAGTVLNVFCLHPGGANSVSPLSFRLTGAGAILHAATLGSRRPPVVEQHADDDFTVTIPHTTTTAATAVQLHLEQPTPTAENAKTAGSAEPSRRPREEAGRHGEDV